jgi:prephenate dehydratase
VKELVVAFQGEHGAYSEEAARQYFGPEVRTMPVRTFADIFRVVARQEAQRGVLPIENAVAGSINTAYDLLLEHDLRIVGEIFLRVRHCLLAPPGTSLEEIRVVRSHPQALSQCERYLEARGWQPEPAYDTAGAAKQLAERPEPGVAVIASRLAAELYGLAVLAVGIEDYPFNYTRFFVLGSEQISPGSRCKTSIVFAVPHRPGSLYECLGLFAARGINLTKLESRPRRNRPWEYIFYLDFEGHASDPPCQEALLGLLQKATFVKVLGSYPAADMPE